MQLFRSPNKLLISVKYLCVWHAVPYNLIKSSLSTVFSDKLKQSFVQKGKKQHNLVPAFLSSRKYEIYLIIFQKKVPTLNQIDFIM